MIMVLGPRKKKVDAMAEARAAKAARNARLGRDREDRDALARHEGRAVSRSRTPPRPAPTTRVEEPRAGVAARDRGVRGPVRRTCPARHDRGA